MALPCNGTSCSFTPTSSGTLSVVANNSCGSSTASTLSINVINVPSQPGPINGNSAPCSGTSQTYNIPSVSGATSYTWTYSGGGTPVGTGTSCTLTPTSSGTLSVVANNSCGSSTASTLNINVINVPSQSGPISGNSTPCSGTPQTYNIPSVSGATSYTWTYSGGGTPVGIGPSCTLAPTSSGTLSVVANNSCGSSTTSTLSINVINAPSQPEPISGNSAPCSETPQTYSISTVSGATSYTWTYSGGGTPVGTGTSCTLTPTSSGTLSVVANNSCGSSTASTLSINVINVPSQPGPISGNTSVCQGTPVTFSISPVSGATSYTWTYGGIVLPSNGTSCSFTPTSSGTLSVVANNSCGIGAMTTLTVTVDSIPEPAEIYSNADSLKSTVLEGNQWYKNFGPIYSANQDFYIPTENGAYYTIITMNGCSSEPSNIININVTDIETTESNNIVKIFPNPSDGQFNVELQNFQNLNFRILSSTGQIIMDNKKIDDVMFEINLTNERSGIYFLNIYGDNISFVKRLILLK
jgi:hypothetical protein